VGAHPTAVLLHAAPLIIFPLLTMVLVWWWGRQLFSPAIGVLAAAMFALEPTALAHGAVLKNDHAATFAFLSLWYALWRYWRSGTPWWAAAVGVAVGLCILSKLSLLFTLALAPVMILLADCVRRRLRWWTMAKCGVVIAVAYALTIPAVQFRLHRLTAVELSKLDATIPSVFPA
jgi:4-amino-4-deoxy-L-arabinose transferase-like glycosyltransferase